MKRPSLSEEIYIDLERQGNGHTFFPLSHFSLTLCICTRRSLTLIQRPLPA